MDAFKGQHLEITYTRISPRDSTGMVDVAAHGAEEWIYACVGSHHGAQVAEGVDIDRVHNFGAALAKLVRAHFGAVRPILDHEPSKRKRGGR